MDVRKYLPEALRGVPTPYLVGGVVVTAVVVIFGIRHFTSGMSAQSDQASQTDHVQLATVADLSSQAGPLSVVGTVTSESQATILAQTAGEVVSLPRSIGDRVSAGSIIGSFENSSQRAAVMQAEGAYEAAQAALAKAQGTTATNSGISSQSAATAAINAQSGLSTALKGAYASLDDAIHTKADALFNNPRGTSPKLISFTIPDSQLVVTVQNERATLESVLASAQSAANGDASDTTAATALSGAHSIVSFLDDVITAVNQAVPNQSISAAMIAADQASLAAARAEVVGALSTITSAKSAYDAALAGAQSASNSATGGTESDIAAAQAALKSAQGTLAAAQAALEKTIIRSPISGTIVSLPITRGDYVPAFSQVAIVSNPGALYLDAQVTSDDAKSLAVGNPATIDGSVGGRITFIAPALDPSTGKIEVKVGVVGDNGSLVDGEVVPLSLGRTTTNTTKNASAAITIPIIAVKIAPTGPEVFSVSASSTLEAHPITLGSILGDRVVVTSGLVGDMQLVTDARGLSVGETVVVDTSEAIPATSDVAH